MRQVDAPSRKVSPTRRLEDHLLVELADAARARLVRRRGRRRRGRDRESCRALADRDAATPSRPVSVPATRSHVSARPQLGELVRRVAARQHVEHALERAPAQPRERRRAATTPSSSPTVHVSLATIATICCARTSQRVARIARSPRPRRRAWLRVTAAQATRSPRNFGNTMPVLAAFDLMAGAADALQAARPPKAAPRSGSPQVDGAHVDAELERRRGDERASAPALSRSSTSSRCSRAIDPWCERTSVSPASSFSARGQPLGEPAAVDEQQRRAMLRGSVPAGAGGCWPRSTCARAWLARRHPLTDRDRPARAAPCLPRALPRAARAASARARRTMVTGRQAIDASTPRELLVNLRRGSPR